MDVRRGIRDALAQGRPVTQKMLVEEANAMRQCGEHDAALLAVEDVLAEHGPQTADAGTHNVHGLVLTELGRERDALGAFERAAARMPENAVMVANLGITALNVGDVAAGIATLRRAVDADPRAAWIYLWLGHAYRRVGDEGRAVIEYRRAHELLRADVERWPAHRESWVRMASVCQSLGDYRGADHARKVLTKIERDGLYQGDSRYVIAGASRKTVAAEAE
jgi:predicted Zn-dependent protease